MVVPLSLLLLLRRPIRAIRTGRDKTVAQTILESTSLPETLSVLTRIVAIPARADGGSRSKKKMLSRRVGTELWIMAPMVPRWQQVQIYDQGGGVRQQRRDGWSTGDQHAHQHRRSEPNVSNRSLMIVFTMLQFNFTRFFNTTCSLFCFFINFHSTNGAILHYSIQCNGAAGSAACTSSYWSHGS